MSAGYSVAERENVNVHDLVFGQVNAAFYIAIGCLQVKCDHAVMFRIL